MTRFEPTHRVALLIQNTKYHKVYNSEPKIEFFTDCKNSSKDKKTFMRFLEHDLDFQPNSPESPDEIIELTDVTYNEINDTLAKLMSKLEHFQTLKNKKLLILVFYVGQVVLVE